jgi:phosphonate transport system substrate-binding protein
MKKAVLLIGVLVLVVGGVFAAGQQEPAELGTDENPLIWSFVPSGETQEIIAGGEEVADMIFDKTGLVVEVSVATEYAGVIEALSSDPPGAHIASLATFSYVLAADRGVAEAALVAVRFGSPTYNGQIITRADSDITEIADLEGGTFARPDPLSTSGWIIPMLTMRSQGIVPEQDLDEIVDAGGHPAVVAAVYNGDVDAGATYVDARGTIEDDNPDVMEAVRVIAVSEDIPNDGVQFHPSVPEEMREQIVTALLEIAETEEGQEALNQAYSWTGLVRRDDTFYDPFRQVLQASGLEVEDLQE